jgi:hypothetical protein
MERRDFISKVVLTGLGTAVLPLSSFSLQPAAKCDVIALVKATPHVRHGALYIPTALDQLSPIFGGWLFSIEHHTFHKQGIGTGNKRDDVGCYMAILGDDKHKESVQIWDDNGEFTLVSARDKTVLRDGQTVISIGEKTFAFRLNQTKSLLSQKVRFNATYQKALVAIVLNGAISHGGHSCGANEVMVMQKDVESLEFAGNTAVITIQEV